MATIDWCGSNLLHFDLSARGELHIELSNPHGHGAGSPWGRDAGNWLCLHEG